MVSYQFHLPYFHSYRIPGDISSSLGLQARPNFQFAADVGTGAAGESLMTPSIILLSSPLSGAIDAATQAFVNGLLGIGGSVIDGAAGLGKAGLSGGNPSSLTLHSIQSMPSAAAGVGGALGGAAAGAASAAGKGVASLGGSLGSSLDFGLSGNGNSQIEAALAKWVDLYRMDSLHSPVLSDTWLQLHQLVRVLVDQLE